MSVNTTEKANALFKSVEDYFETIERDALPKAEADIESLRKFMLPGSEDVLTDRRVNLIFKDKVLLKAATRARKKRKRKTENEEDGSDLAPSPDVSECEEIDDDKTPEDEYVRMAYGAPQAPTFAAINRNLKW